MKVITALLLVFSLSTYAVTPIKAGEKSPTDGYIFSKSEEKQVREINEKKIALEELAVKQADLIKIQEDRIVILEKEVDTRTLTGWEKTGYVIIGIVGTASAVYLAGQLRR